MPATYNSMSRLSSQTLKMQSFVQLQLFFEELVVPAIAHVGSGIIVDCGIMYVPNGWWKHK
jgi:hypothetical protein